RAIVEEKDATASEKSIDEINTGFLACPTELLAQWLPMLGNKNAQGEYYLTDILAMAVNERIEVETLSPSHEWEVSGINSKDQLAALERTHQLEIAKTLMREGVTLADPTRIDEATLGENARVGPYARIRPGTQLGDEVHIGNFVEVKASQFGAGSKANHLSYIGDTSVGKSVNIGAGTITCNYDGANKHRTVIEDNVHIGSDVQLVAPVKIGKGADIGAGTTVWKDVPPGGGLTLNTKTQISKTDWKRPLKKPKA
ncbi:MAG: DapH/DapD/GlmU-related protein, partial [Usitatibacteraceae bacterium]